MNRRPDQRPQAQARAVERGFDASLPSIEINKVLKNTYMLLGLAMLFSGACAYIAAQMNLPRPGIFMFLGGFFGLTMFINYFRNSVVGIFGVFALTGFLGYCIAPIVNHYLQTAAGTQVVMSAMTTTGVIFLVLSGYVLVTRKNFAFIGGMLFAGIIAAVVLGLANVFFFQMPALSLAISAVFVLLMSGMILYETSEIVHGHQTNYILATTSIFVSLYNLFQSLLMIFGFFGDE